MKKVTLFWAILLPLLLVSACAVSKRNNYPDAPAFIKMDLSSSPQGAAVYQDGKYLGTTPCTVEVATNYNIYPDDRLNQKGIAKAIDRAKIKLVFMHDDYQTEEVIVYPNPAALKVMRINGILYNIPYEYPSGLFHLFKNRKSIVDTTIPTGSAYEKVERDNPGRTALEKTIIRWYFDSAPRGARVYWRVISSVPEQVKNTNDLYLGSTPFEETRSFNILGLTYVNSRDVQIEIRVSKKGYVDQVKRFNVRQAIDQQEISSFFELVEE